MAKVYLKTSTSEVVSAWGRSKDFVVSKYFEMRKIYLAVSTLD
ncbi:MAG: hypothetical protein SNJ29_09025 [Rikenellaceae bacterium]